MPYQGDVDFGGWMLHRVDDLVPLGQVGTTRIEMQFLGHDFVQPLLVQQPWNLVDVVHIHGRYHGAHRHVGEERNLAAHVLGQHAVGAAQQDVRLDAERQQLLHRMLRRLTLEFARGGDVRHQGEVQVDDIVRAELDTHLTDGLDERLRFDIADGTANLDQRDIGALRPLLDASLDFVGDMRDHLHGGAEVVAAPLLADDAFINLAGGEVVALTERGAHEAFVVAKVEVGLGAVFRYEYLAVLKRAHGARIDIDVRIELEQRYLETAGFEDGSEGGGSDALAKGRNNTAGDKHVFGHARPVPRRPLRLRYPGITPVQRLVSR